MREIKITCTFVISEPDLTRKEESQIAMDVIQELDMAASEITKMYPVSFSMMSQQNINTERTA